MRKVECYIGGEEVESKSSVEKKVFAEIILFLLFGTGAITFFLIHPDFLEKWLGSGNLRVGLSILIILVLSPFGTHLLSKGCVHIWQAGKK